MRHSAHGLNGIVACSRLAAEHQRVSAIVDGISDVGHFSSCGAWVVDHGVKHLCGHDDWFLCSHTFANDAPLYAWDALYGYLDAKIAARNHDAVRRLDNLVNIVNAFLVLYL